MVQVHSKIRVHHSSNVILSVRYQSVDMHLMWGLLLVLLKWLLLLLLLLWVHVDVLLIAQ